MIVKNTIWTPPDAAIDPCPAEVSMFIEKGALIFRSEYGYPFYIYDRDTAGKSACVESCTETWAPVTPHDSDTQAIGHWKLVDRSDGAKQWAYEGKPIYIYVPQVVSGTDPHDPHWHELVP